jgi:hypothetical protein
MKFFSGLIFCVFICSAALAQTNTLDHYLDVAKSNSPLLKDLRNQLLSNQVDSLRLRAGLKPQVNANSGGLYAPIVDGYGYSEPITNNHTLNALLSANKAIVGRNNINAQVDEISLQSKS